MILKLLKRLGRHRVIMDRQNNLPYLERYYVFLKDRKRFPFNVFIHKFLRSDPDDVHDHPWPYASIGVDLVISVFALPIVFIELSLILM